MENKKPTKKYINNTFNELINGLDNVVRVNDIVKKATTELIFSNDTLMVMEWQTLSTLPFNEWTVLENHGVRFKRVKHSTKECFYITELDPDLSDEEAAYLGYQTHDCKEVGRVISGSMVEMVENNKKYESGDIFIYPMWFSHKPKSFEKTVLEVEFINPNN